MSFRNTFLFQRSGTLKGEEVSGGEQPEELSRMAGRILVADADSSNLRHVTSVLKQLNFQVLTARDGQTALKMAREHEPQIVLASIHLPVMDGYELCKELKVDPRTENVQFMFIVASGEIPDQVIGHETYASDYIQTPISLPEFKSRINALIKLRDARETRRAEPAQQDLGLDSFLETLGEPEPEPVLEEALPAPELPFLEESQVAEKESDQLFEKDLAELEQYLSEYRQKIQQEEVLPAEPSDLETVDDLLASMQRREAEPPDEKPAEVELLISEVEELQDSEIDEPPAVESFPHVEFQPAPAPSRAGEISTASLEVTGRHVGLEHSEPEETVPVTPELSISASELYMAALGYVLHSMRRAGRKELPDVQQGEKIVEVMFQSMRSGNGLLLAATDRHQEFEMTSHSVNTAIIAMRIAEALKSDEGRQKRVGLAGLLHEVGIVRLPEKLLHKAAVPTEREVEILRQRPIYSAEILEQLGPDYRWLSRVARQVNERENGTGFPLGLAGNDIVEEARILSIADVFESCIHFRPYRNAMTGYQSLYEMTTDASRPFSDRLVKALIKGFSLYPYNEYVVLNTGEIGRVIDINSQNLSRPTVEILFGTEGQTLKTLKTLDLAQNPSLYIARAITQDALPGAS